MSPQEKEQFKKEIVKEVMNTLGSFNKIPFNVQEALKSRIGGGTTLALSSKNLDSEDQAVNEGGAATYDVLGDPDGFLEAEVNGTTRYIPYY